MTPLVALERFTYDKRQLEIGDGFNAEDGHASLLVLMGRAKRKEATYQTRVMTPENGSKKHRRMKAEFED